MEVFLDKLYVFLLSMVPFIELRGGIMLGFAQNFNILENYLLCVVGNLLRIPFVLLFIKAIFNYFRRFSFFERIISSLERRAINKANSDKFKKYTYLALMLFVAIPIPGTGAYSANLIATVLELRVKYAFYYIALGVMIAGVIMSLISYGVFAVFS